MVGYGYGYRVLMFGYGYGYIKKKHVSEENFLYFLP